MAEREELLRGGFSVIIHLAVFCRQLEEDRA